MPEKEKTVETLGYEQALAELEEIVDRLESDPPSLEESTQLYERGRALVQRCATLLELVEVRLRTLEEAQAGEPD